MLKAFTSFKIALKLIFQDKISFLLSLIPIIIGIISYIFFGRLLLSEGIEFGNQLISKYISNQTLGDIFYYIVALFLTVMLYFMVNLTFVIFVSLIASPFNDLLSARIEKKYLKKELPSLGESLSGMFKRIVTILINEVKKLSLILGLTLLAVFLGYIPLLTPFSIIISALVLALGFVDYSWSRHELVYDKCKQDTKKHWVSYSFGGAFFMLLIAIPFVNLIVPAYATSYFTVLWVRNNDFGH
ncbi:MAG: EI24 domain-containing protein [Bacteriovoracaceae bacterium]|jgi:CysZ protein|nr:hypothetical protein [Halobacteriovoraceae bacterium]MDP7319000.1 EI24 domain-containing protein [Bacteriovoracaceae bacterium]